MVRQSPWKGVAPNGVAGSIPVPTAKKENIMIRRIIEWIKMLIYFEAPEIDEDWIEECRKDC